MKKNEENINGKVDVVNDATEEMEVGVRDMQMIARLIKAARDPQEAYENVFKFGVLTGSAMSVKR